MISMKTMPYNIQLNTSIFCFLQKYQFLNKQAMEFQIIQKLNSSDQNEDEPDELINKRLFLLSAYRVFLVSDAAKLETNEGMECRRCTEETHSVRFTIGSDCQKG